MPKCCNAPVTPVGLACLGWIERSTPNLHAWLAALSYLRWRGRRADNACFAQAEGLLDRGIHPLRIAEGYEMACKVALQRLDEIQSRFVFDNDQLEPLIRTCMTTLSSKM